MAHANPDWTTAIGGCLDVFHGIAGAAAATLFLGAYYGWVPIVACGVIGLALNCDKKNWHKHEEKTWNRGMGQSLSTQGADWEFDAFVLNGL